MKISKVSGLLILISFILMLGALPVDAKSSFQRSYGALQTTYSPDGYEPDNSFTEAKTITVGPVQTHTFHQGGDYDWIKFNALAGQTYVIETSNLSSEADTFIYLYDTDGQTVITNNDDSYGLASRIQWTFTQNGTYFVMVRHYDFAGIGKYDVSVNIDIMPPTADTISPVVIIDNMIVGDNKFAYGDQFKLRFSEPLQNENGQAISAVQAGVDNTFSYGNAIVTTTDNVEFLVTIQNEVDLTGGRTIVLPAGTLNDLDGNSCDQIIFDVSDAENLKIPPMVTLNNTLVNDPVNIWFYDDGQWQSNITEISLNGTTLLPEQYSMSNGLITLAGNLFPVPGEYQINIASNGYTNELIYQDVFLEGPQLSYPYMITPGRALEISFNDDGAWHSAITEIQLDGQPLTVDKYTISPGKIVIDGDLFLDNRYYQIGISAANYMQTWINTRVVIPTVMGTVYAPDGSRFIPGLESDAVVVFSSSEFMDDEGAAQVNNDGTFIIEHLSAGTYQFKVRAYGNNNPYTDSLPVTINVGSGIVDLSLSLSNPSVTGQLLTPQGTTISGGYESMVSLRVASTDGNYDDWVEVGPSGEFKVGGLSPGSYFLKAKVWGDNPYTDSLPVNVTIEEGVVKNLSINLTNPSVVGYVYSPNGTMLTSDGNEFEGEIRIFLPDGSSDWIETNFNGEFKLGGLTPGTYSLKAKVWWGPYTDSMPVNVVIEEGILKNLNLNLTTPTVMGSVYSPNGGPVYGWGEVIVTTPAGEEVDWYHISDGSYQIGGLADGTYFLKAVVYNGPFIDSLPIAVDILQNSLITQNLTVQYDPAASIFSFSQPVYTVTEDGGQAAITVTRTGNTTNQVTISYYFYGGTAVQGTDFTVSSNTITFNAGETSKDFIVNLINDSNPEEIENVYLSLGGYSDYTNPIYFEDPDYATLTIQDDDNNDSLIISVNTPSRTMDVSYSRPSTLSAHANRPADWTVTVYNPNNELVSTMVMGTLTDLSIVWAPSDRYQPNGTYTIKYNAVDSYGNNASEVIQTIEVYNYPITITQVRILDGNGTPVSQVRQGESFQVEATIENLNTNIESPMLIVQTKDSTGTVVGIGTVKLNRFYGNDSVVLSAGTILPDSAVNGDYTVDVMVWSGWEMPEILSQSYTNPNAFAVGLSS